MSWKCTRCSLWFFNDLLPAPEPVSLATAACSPVSQTRWALPAAGPWSEWQAGSSGSLGTLGRGGGFPGGNVLVGLVYFPKLFRRPEKLSPEPPLALPWSRPFPLHLPGVGVWAGPRCPFPFLQGLPGSVKLWGTHSAPSGPEGGCRLGFFQQESARGHGLALLESNLLGESQVGLVWTCWSTVLWEAAENSFQTMLGKVQFFFFFLMCFRHTQ